MLGRCQGNLCAVGHSRNAGMTQLGTDAETYLYIRLARPGEAARRPLGPEDYSPTRTLLEEKREDQRHGQRLLSDTPIRRPKHTET